MYDQGCVHSHAGTTVARCYYFLLKARCQSQVRYVFQLPPKFYLHPRCGGVVGFNRVPYPVRCRLFCGALICWCGKMLPNVTSKLSRDIVILGLFGQCYHIFSLIFGQFHFLIIFIKVFILYSSRYFFWVKKPLNYWSVLTRTLAFF